MSLIDKVRKLIPKLQNAAIRGDYFVGDIDGRKRCVFLELMPAEINLYRWAPSYDDMRAQWIAEELLK